MSRTIFRLLIPQSQTEQEGMMGMSIPGDCEKTPLVFVIINCPEAFHGRRGKQVVEKGSDYE